jgi:putative ABC transport system ATP-binding protein
MLELRDVSKRYRSGDEIVSAVDHVSMTLDAGELVTLHGPSGSGKSTVLMLAAGFLSPDTGAVLFEGQNVAGFTRRELTHYRRSSIGVVMQTMHYQAGLSILDNAGAKLIAEGMTVRKARARTMPLLELVGISDRAHHRPDEISLGERQRVGIAQALANRPRLVLADEPTGNLDSARSADFLSLLAEACTNRGAACLLVTHDDQAAHYATRVLHLVDGHLDDQAPAARAVGA